MGSPVSIPDWGANVGATNNVSAGSKDVQPDKVKSLLIKSVGAEDAELMSSAYGGVIQKMADNGFTSEKIAQSVLQLEGQVKELHGMFGLLGLDKPAVRKWLVKVIASQKDQKAFLFSEDFNLLSRIKIGRNELYSLMNANREGLGLFEKTFSHMPVYEVTETAFDRLFGNSDGKYSKDKDAVTLDKFTATMNDEVLPFAGLMSQSPLLKTLQLFAAKRFVLINKDEMVGRVRTAIYNLSVKNIYSKYPMPDEGQKDGKKEVREKLLKQIKIYCFGDEGAKTKPNVVENVVFNKNRDGKGGKEAFDYLEGYEDSVLIRYIEAASVGADKDSDDKALYLAGLATLCGENGLISHLESQGGREKDVYGIKMKNKEVMEAFLATIIDDYGLSVNGWSGKTTFGPDGFPNGVPLKDQINWLKTKPKEVEAEVQKETKAI